MSQKTTRYVPPPATSPSIQVDTHGHRQAGAGEENASQSTSSGDEARDRHSSLSGRPRLPATRVHHAKDPQQVVDLILSGRLATLYDTVTFRVEWKEHGEWQELPICPDLCSLPTGEVNYAPV